MDDRSAIWVGALAGAIIGSVCGYLFLTDQGRRLREDLEPRLTNLVSELRRARMTADRAQAATGGTQPERPFGAM